MEIRSQVINFYEVVVVNQGRREDKSVPNAVRVEPNIKKPWLESLWEPEDIKLTADDVEEAHEDDTWSYLMGLNHGDVTLSINR